MYSRCKNQLTHLPSKQLTLLEIMNKKKIIYIFNETTRSFNAIKLFFFAEKLDIPYYFTSRFVKYKGVNINDVS